MKEAKRCFMEQAAIAAMQGLMRIPEAIDDDGKTVTLGYESRAKFAVRQAQALWQELEKTRE